MKRATLALIASVALGGCGSGDTTDAVAPDADANEPTAQEREAVLGALQTVFDGLARKDGALLRSVFHPGVVMHSVEGGSGRTTVISSTLEGLINRVETGEDQLTERMWDPVVHVSGGLATIWTPYDFYVGSELSHCGADTAILTDDGSGWRIASLSWTRLQPPDCSLHPEGPPA